MSKFPRVIVNGGNNSWIEASKVFPAHLTTFTGLVDHRLVRLRESTIEWTRSDAEEHPTAMLSDTSQRIPSSRVEGIKKIALVSHKLANEQGLPDCSQHFAQINKRCDEQGCDTVLYALYTWDERSPVPKSHAAIFGNLAHVQRVIVEVGKPEDSYEQCHVEVWLRSQPDAVVAQQRFAFSKDPDRRKSQFILDLPGRMVKGACLVLCGETNIVSFHWDEVNDPFRFVDRLRELDVGLVLNPIHYYMGPRMRRKRRFYSLDSRIVVSVWNHGKKRESHNPWTVFHDGSEKTSAVQELSRPFADRPDIRIGIVDVESLVRPDHP
jgi:hypothetical protein